MDTTKSVTHISLCAGYGGIDLGLSRVIPNLRTVVFSEIEAFPCANLVAKMEQGYLDAAPIWTDLKTLSFRYLHGKVGILSGGFPCQPFSAAGKRGGDEDPRHLFPHILRGITECQPRLVFLENVEGIISAKLKGDGWRDPAGTPVLLHVLRELERVGYRATAGVFSSREVGASHQRKRVFILAANQSDRLQGWETRKRSETWENAARRGETPMADSTSRGEVPTQFAGQLCVSRFGRQATRPLPPGPDQWWWEPTRVVQSFTRIANRHGSFIEEARESAVGDTKDVLSNGGDHHSRIGVESRSLPESGDPSGSADVANGSHNGPSAQRELPQLCDPKGREKSTGYSTAQSHERGDEAGATRDGSIESPLGRDSDGSSHWLDYAKLSETVDSRIDELRLLGNGVDPDVVAKAFVTLYGRLVNGVPVVGT